VDDRRSTAHGSDPSVTSGEAPCPADEFGWGERLDGPEELVQVDQPDRLRTPEQRAEATKNLNVGAEERRVLRRGADSCGFRTMSITDSGPSRSPIPAEADHSFRRKPITDSGGSRSLNG
jgi:hypothetical protein